MSRGLSLGKFRKRQREQNDAFEEREKVWREIQAQSVITVKQILLAEWIKATQSQCDFKEMMQDLEIIRTSTHIILQINRFVLFYWSLQLGLPEFYVQRKRIRYIAYSPCFKDWAPSLDWISSDNRNWIMCIFHWLPTSSLFNVRLVCKSWKQFADHPSMWRYRIERVTRKLGAHFPLTWFRMFEEPNSKWMATLAMRFPYSTKSGIPLKAVQEIFLDSYASNLVKQLFNYEVDVEHGKVLISHYRGNHAVEKNFAMAVIDMGLDPIIAVTLKSQKLVLFKSENKRYGWQLARPKDFLQYYWNKIDTISYPIESYDVENKN